MTLFFAFLIVESLYYSVLIREAIFFLDMRIAVIQDVQKSEIHFRWGTKSYNWKQETGNDCDVILGHSVLRQANFLVVSCLPRNRTPLNDVTMIARFLYLPEVKFPVTRERIIDIETFAVLIRILCRFFQENIGKRRIMTVDPRVSGRRKNVGVILQLIMGSS